MIFLPRTIILNFYCILKFLKIDIPNIRYFFALYTTKLNYKSIYNNTAFEGFVFLHGILSDGVTLRHCYLMAQKIRSLTSTLMPLLRLKPDIGFHIRVYNKSVIRFMY